MTAVYGIKVGDHLGSTNVISDYEGKLYEHLEYTPYGETFVDEAPNATEHVNYKFTGKEYDPESLLYYFGARYHDALFSRWISPDPGEEGLNWYRFCNNNPVIYNDPDGESATLIGAFSGALIGGAISELHVSRLLLKKQKTYDILRVIHNLPRCFLEKPKDLVEERSF